MRPLLVLLVSAALVILGAGPAAAQQPYLGYVLGRQAEAAANADAARYREVTTANELAAAQARLQADQAVSNLQAARSTALLTRGARGSEAPPVTIDTSRLVSIPDDALAQSNARIRAAAANRR